MAKLEKSSNEYKGENSSGFVEAARMYRKDMSVKEAVLHDFMTQDDIDHNALQVYLAAWSSMPFIR